jgi:uncharacterized membrane-anchored protein
MPDLSATRVDLSAAHSFGHDTAMFNGLLGFMARVSLVLWAVVLITVLVRWAALRVYRRPLPRTAPDLLGPGTRDGRVSPGAEEASLPNVVAPIGGLVPLRPDRVEV